MSLNIGQRLGVFRQSVARPIFSRDVWTKPFISPIGSLQPSPLPQTFPRRQYNGKARSREQHRRINSKLASGSLLILTANSVAETGTTCTVPNKNNARARDLHHSTKQRTLEVLAGQLWKRAIHTQHDKTGELSEKTSKGKDTPKEQSTLR